MASSEQEVIDIKQRLELERSSGLFVDYAKGRVYLPLEDLRRYSVSEEDLAQNRKKYLRAAILIASIAGGK